MSDMLKQLLKAGLVSDSQAEAAQAQQRPPRDKGGQGRGRGGHKRDAGPRPDRGGRRGTERSPAFSEERALAREREAVAMTSSERARRDQRAHQVAREGKVSGRTHGHRRWYFRDRLGTLTFIEVHDKAAAGLEAGETAIVESPRGEAWLVERDAALTLLALSPDWVRHVGQSG